MTDDLFIRLDEFSIDRNMSITGGFKKTWGQAAPLRHKVTCLTTKQSRTRSDRMAEFGL